MKISQISLSPPKTHIKLTPLSPQDVNISLQMVTISIIKVQLWSNNNVQLYQQLILHGMAEYICNKDFLFLFYRELCFSGAGIQKIDKEVGRFRNLKILNLVSNNIKVHIQLIEIMQNIPDKCKQLYLDFNLIDRINIKTPLCLQLLCLSNNFLTDALLNPLLTLTPNLRSLSLTHNHLINLHTFITTIKANCPKLKILAIYGNPMSMLAVYYRYVVREMELLGDFDGRKVVKVELVKVQQKVQDKKQVVGKQEKKDGKKDGKKGGKDEKQVIEEPSKTEAPKPQQMKQKPKQSLTTITLSLLITNLQQLTGITYDASIFPQNFDPKKTQSNYSIIYELMGEKCQDKEGNVGFDCAVIENQQFRINFQFSVQKVFQVSLQSLQLFNQGIKITILKQQPKMLIDPQTGQQKPQLISNIVTMLKIPIGAVFVDLRSLLNQNNKQIKLKYRVFCVQAVEQPLFSDPVVGQRELIEMHKEQLQKQLRKVQEQRKKKLQQEQSIKTQKKSQGKDLKKAPQKKGAKKQGKDQMASTTDKRKCQKCDYPIQDKLYCYLGEGRMYKARKQLLCVGVRID